MDTKIKDNEKMNTSDNETLYCQLYILGILDFLICESCKNSK